MKPDAYKQISQYRIRQGRVASDDSFGNNGAFMVPIFTRGGLIVLSDRVDYSDCILGIIVSDGEGWDHVSVSLPKRCPTWMEMCWVKDLFFEPEEVAMQIHPAKSQYVNYHQHCLHLWRPYSKRIPLPPMEFVGPKMEAVA